MTSRSDYFALLFNSGETVCAGSMYETKVISLEQALASEGPFISINPLTERRADMNVTAHRNFLVEMDEGSLTDQMTTIKKAGLPYSTCVYSGGKSLHFVVALEAAVDAATWRKWAKALVASVPGADHSTTNPSRFTRLAGANRHESGVEQSIEYIGQRVNNDVFEHWIKPRIQPELPNFRKIYADLTGATGLDAAHPMTKAFIEGTHPCLTGRNNALFKSAADLRDCGVDVEETYNLLAPTATTLGLTEKEVANTIRSAYSRRR